MKQNIIKDIRSISITNKDNNQLIILCNEIRSFDNVVIGYLYTRTFFIKNKVQVFVLNFNGKPKTNAECIEDLLVEFNIKIEKYK